MTLVRKYKNKNDRFDYVYIILEQTFFILLKRKYLYVFIEALSFNDL